MDINRLHYFCTVYQTGSLTEASRLLHISQPALSKAIKTLEDEVGVRLTIPSGRGIAITDEGHRLFERAMPLVSEILSLKENLRSPKSAKPVVRLGSFEVFTTYMIGKIATGVLKGVALEVAELVPGELEKALVARHVDIGISYLPIPMPEIELIKVATIQMAVYALKSEFSNVEFSELPFCCPNILVEGTPSKAKGLDGWPDDKYPRQIVYRVGMMEGALELCRQGMTAAYFPKFIVDLHNAQVKAAYALEEIAIPKEMKINRKQDVFLMKRKTDTESPEFRKLANELRKLS